MIDADRSALSTHPRYPRSNTYDAEWVIANQMGPNALWLMEALTQALSMEPGLRILDLGCGKAMTSVFLAKEFGAQVWAADLWIPPTENLERIRQAGVEDQVLPLHAEAHDLPFAEGFFDLIVSVDAYHYFGTADLYLGYVTRFLRAGGRLGVVAPAVFEEIDGEVPVHLQPFWDWEFCSFHGPDWWRRHWSKTGKATIEVADALYEGWRDWLTWEQLVGPTLGEGWMKDASVRAASMLEADQGHLLGFTRIVGRTA